MKERVIAEVVKSLPIDGSVQQSPQQEQVQGLLFGQQVSWQGIIYDLINTEQLKPWDVDLSVLAGRYLDKVRELEEADFFVSSKVLLASAFLLRLKSEVLLHEDLPSLDAILFGKEEKKGHVQERLELDEDIPVLVPRTPLPRQRKVTLNELMGALGKALSTETRRIKRIVVDKQREMETGISLPTRKIKVGDHMRQLFSKLQGIFKTREEKLAFSAFAGKSAEEQLATFYSLLHLDTQEKLVVEQEGHHEEIWVWMKALHERKHSALLAEMRREVALALEGQEKVERIERGLEVDEG
jgi:chromatin segregation and condensation protein Rec8/ScpA/Scc1 (kleisin family)